MEQNRIVELKKQANKIRKHIITEVHCASSGHPGGSLSSADIMTFLYFEEMKIDPKNTQWADRDRFVLSKGHCAPALYATLAERGFFPTEELPKFRSAESYLEGHPNMRTVPGVDMSTGSLGQGISGAVGMAIAGKIDKKDYRVFALLGDGESQEGEVWEAAMAAAHYKLDNLTAFLDHNYMQIDGMTADVMSPEPLDEKFAAFGWNVIKINGHDFNQIEEAIIEAKRVKDKPSMIIAETIKGKGVSFMEGRYEWHGKAPCEEENIQALKDLDEIAAKLEVE